MSIIDKANEYVEHLQKMDEPYTDTIKRDAYADGYRDAIDRACKWMKWIREKGSYYDTFIAEESIRDFRQMMESTGESVLDYIKIED